MHTFVGKSCRIHHNSDMSGQVIISTPGAKIEVSGEDLLEFVAVFIRGEKINSLEQKPWQEFLK